MTKILLWIFLLFPISTLANSHLIQINAIQSFPAKVTTSSITTAKFKILNIAWMPLTVIDKSEFPNQSVLSILSNDCNVMIKPGESCNIELQLKAPTTAQIISTQLTETTTPSPDLSDVVSYPIVIEVTKATDSFTIIPSAGAGGAISPSKPQKVKEGTNLTFTAIPDAGDQVKQWFVDESSAQEGGNVFVLSNIQSDHRVKVVYTNQKSDGAFVALGGNFGYLSGGALSVSNDNGKSFHNLSLVPAYERVLGAACTDAENAAAPICVIAGEHSTLFVSNKLTDDWQKIELDKNISFTNVSCSRGGRNASCIAAGAESAEGPVVVATTNNGGKNWTTQVIDRLYGYDTIVRSSCSGYRKRAICSLVGHTGGNSILETSLDGGDTWKDFSNILPTSSALLSTSCSGKGSNAVCIAVGDDSYPLIVATQNGGSSWSIKHLNNNNLPGYFYGASCTGNGSTAVCTAVGYTYTGGPGNYDHHAILAMSFDGAKTWTFKNIKNLPEHDVIFLATSCTGSGANIFCVAAGFFLDAPKPALAISTDSGNTWTMKDVTNISQGGFYSAACHGSGKSASCAVGGFLDFSDDIGKPLLVTTNDSGLSWKLVTQGLPNQGGFVTMATIKD